MTDTTTTTPQVALMPCPFCGNTRVETFEHEVSGDKLYGVRCRTPLCFIDIREFDTKKQAVRRWNTRTPSTPPVNLRRCVDSGGTFTCRDKACKIQCKRIGRAPSEVRNLAQSIVDHYIGLNDFIEDQEEGQRDLERLAKAVLGTPRAETAAPDSGEGK